MHDFSESSIAALDEGLRVIAQILNRGLIRHKLAIAAEPQNENDNLEHARQVLLQNLKKMRSRFPQRFDDFPDSLQTVTPWCLGFLFDEKTSVGVGLAPWRNDYPEDWTLFAENISMGNWPTGWKSEQFRKRIVEPVQENQKWWTQFLKSFLPRKVTEEMIRNLFDELWPKGKKASQRKRSDKRRTKNLGRGFEDLGFYRANDGWYMYRKITSPRVVHQWKYLGPWNSKKSSNSQRVQKFFFCQ